MDIHNHIVEIITGQYGTGTYEQNEIVNSILGDADARENFELYFHWYNIIHEFGHGLVSFNSQKLINPVDEELLVNDFAVAYWRFYGEEKK